jgi:hypothetical protein
MTNYPDVSGASVSGGKRAPIVGAFGAAQSAAAISSVESTFARIAEDQRQ